MRPRTEERPFKDQSAGYTLTFFVIQYQYNKFVKKQNKNVQYDAMLMSRLLHYLFIKIQSGTAKWKQLFFSSKTLPVENLTHCVVVFESQQFYALRVAM